jgi:hypothetical protein
MSSERRRPRRLAAALGASLALTGGALAIGTAQAEQPGAIDASRTSPAPAGAVLLAAHLSRALSVNDTGHLHLLKAFGSVLLEEGHAGGTLPGQAKVRLTVGSTVTASFTIRTRDGTIYGSGRAALHSSGRYASFGGSLSVSHGTGRYVDAHGNGKLYGVIDRRTSALTVQTIGTLSY